ncbi:MAG: hypothetical protein M3M96_07635 [Candidatus Eremiobacteraeota bacterium]|nr:hypothetical protein [Candidatus Eremiobacteraeota bacterium]
MDTRGAPQSAEPESAIVAVAIISNGRSKEAFETVGTEPARALVVLDAPGVDGIADMWLPPEQAATMAVNMQKDTSRLNVFIFTTLASFA